jgi:hypothetical protein
MTKEPEKPAVEFRMALAGPLTSPCYWWSILGYMGWGTRFKRASDCTCLLAGSVRGISYLRSLNGVRQ